MTSVRKIIADFPLYFLIYTFCIKEYKKQEGSLSFLPA